MSPLFHIIVVTENEFLISWDWTSSERFLRCSVFITEIFETIFCYLDCILRIAFIIIRATWNISQYGGEILTNGILVNMTFMPILKFKLFRIYSYKLKHWNFLKIFISTALGYLEDFKRTDPTIHVNLEIENFC